MDRECCDGCAASGEPGGRAMRLAGPRERARRTGVTLDELVTVLPVPISARKWALLAVACCRRALPLFEADWCATGLDRLQAWEISLE